MKAESWVSRLSYTAKTMCATLAGLCVFFLVVGLAVTTWVFPFEPALPYAIGLLAGTLHSMLKVVLLERTLNRAADIGEYGQAKGYGTMQAMLRNLITLALFAMVFAFRDIFGLFGTILGVLALQMSGYVVGYILRKNPAKV